MRKESVEKAGRGRKFKSIEYGQKHRNSGNKFLEEFRMLRGVFFKYVVNIAVSQCSFILVNISTYLYLQLQFCIPLCPRFKKKKGKKRAR